MKSKFMLIAVSALAVLATLTACSGLGATNTNNCCGQTQLRTISVNGHSVVYVVPDIAYINIGVHSDGDTVTEALNGNNSQAQAIANTLSEFGIDPKDIQTTAFNVYPNQEYNSEGQVVRKFFSVDNTVYVKVRELDKLGQILDAVVRAGANQINGISFDVENRTEAEAQARTAAIADARMKAEELAAAAGVTLGELQTASVYNSGGAIPVYEGKGGYMSADASVPMSAGQMQVTADASLTYIIK